MVLVVSSGQPKAERKKRSMEMIVFDGIQTTRGSLEANPEVVPSTRRRIFKEEQASVRFALKIYFSVLRSGVGPGRVSREVQDLGFPLDDVGC